MEANGTNDKLRKPIHLYKLYSQQKAWSKTRGFCFFPVVKNQGGNDENPKPYAETAGNWAHGTMQLKYPVPEPGPKRPNLQL